MNKFLALAPALVLGSGRPEAIKALQKANRLAQGKSGKGAIGFPMNFPAGNWITKDAFEFLSVDVVDKPTGSWYSLTGVVDYVQWADIFADVPDEHKVSHIYTIGVKDLFTPQAKVMLLQKVRKGKDSHDLTVHRHYDVEFDGVHVIFHSREKRMWYVTKSIEELALPFWDFGAMLIPVTLTILGIIVWFAIVCHLCKQKQEEAEPQVIYEVDENLLRDLEAGRLRRPTEVRLSFARKMQRMPSITALTPPRHKKVKRTPKPREIPSLNRHKKSLSKMQAVRGSVRTLPKAPEERPEVKEPNAKLVYNGELGKVMLSV